MRANICVFCQKACGDCSWSKYDPKTKELLFEPVPGWTATPSYQKNGTKIVPTYHITAGPEFEPDDDYKGQKSTAVNKGYKVCKWCGDVIPRGSVRVSFCAKCNPYDRNYNRRGSYMNRILKIGGKRELPEKYKVSVP